MANLNQRRKHLIDGDRQPKRFRSLNQGLIQGTDFGFASGLDVLKHAACVVPGEGQHPSQSCFKFGFFWHRHAFHGRHLSRLPVNHHARVKQRTFEEFTVFETGQRCDWIDG